MPQIQMNCTIYDFNIFVLKMCFPPHLSQILKTNFFFRLLLISQTCMLHSEKQMYKMPKKKKKIKTMES